MQFAVAIVIIATAAAIFLSLVRDRAIGFLAFVAGCAAALVWAIVDGGIGEMNSVFGICVSAAVVWGLLESIVIKDLRQPPKRG